LDTTMSADGAACARVVIGDASTTAQTSATSASRRSDSEDEQFIL